MFHNRDKNKKLFILFILSFFTLFIFFYYTKTNIYHRILHEHNVNNKQNIEGFNNNDELVNKFINKYSIEDYNNSDHCLGNTQVLGSYHSCYNNGKLNRDNLGLIIKSGCRLLHFDVVFYPSDNISNVSFYVSMHKKFTAKFYNDDQVKKSSNGLELGSLLQFITENAFTNIGRYSPENFNDPLFIYLNICFTGLHNSETQQKLKNVINTLSSMIQSSLSTYLLHNNFKNFTNTNIPDYPTLKEQTMKSLQKKVILITSGQNLLDVKNIKDDSNNTKYKNYTDIEINKLIRDFMIRTKLFEISHIYINSISNTSVISKGNVLLQYSDFINGNYNFKKYLNITHPIRMVNFGMVIPNEFNQDTKLRNLKSVIEKSEFVDTYYHLVKMIDNFGMNFYFTYLFLNNNNTAKIMNKFSNGSTYYAFKPVNKNIQNKNCSTLITPRPVDPKEYDRHIDIEIITESDAVANIRSNLYDYKAYFREKNNNKEPQEDIHYKILS